MNLIMHSVRSKGAVAFISRIGSIVSRFGFTATKMEQNLAAYLETLRRFDSNATFPITATVLARHQSLIRRMSTEGVEFAVHGYIHADHALLPAETQLAHLEMALDIFSRAGVPAEGFRGPYLRYNEGTFAAAQSLGLAYVSNETVVYDVLDCNRLSERKLNAYEKALRLYSAMPAETAIVRPRMRGQLVELPVAMPDDEIMIDRLGMQEGSQIGRVWTDMVNRSYERGDLLTLQLHPERGIMCREGLADALSEARAKSPAVWIAQLKDIAAWWQLRATAQLRVENAQGGRWLLKLDKHSRFSVLLQNMESPEARPWYGPYSILHGLPAIVESPVRPTIGVPPEAVELRQFLREEGYVVEGGLNRDDYALYIDKAGPLAPAEQASILHSIESSAAPLVRLARWPGGARSALAVTGDIDALTVLDFISRTWEVR